MASMKAIKRRISSVNSTRQIMKAMDLVAASKLQKTRLRLEGVRPMYSYLSRVVYGILADEEAEVSVYAEQRDEIKNVAYIVFTGDRGLCGSYNSNISKETLTHINSAGADNESIIAAGVKGWEFLLRNRKNVVTRIPGASELSEYEDAERISEMVISMFLSGEVDRVFLSYTKFESVLSHIPQVVQLLPVTTDIETNGYTDWSAYDPGMEEFISSAVPMYVSMVIYNAMMESAVCEQAARMTSMDAASRNASNIIDDLTLEYNRKRQGMITQEITEIVSGANAMQ